MTSHILALPRRKGLPPEVDGPFPHYQVTQLAPCDLQEEIFRRAAALPGVSVDESLVSVPRARAFMLSEDRAGGPSEAFQKGREFAHIHPNHDGSFHMTLPAETAK